MFQYKQLNNCNQTKIKNVQKEQEKSVFCENFQFFKMAYNNRSGYVRKKGLNLIEKMFNIGSEA